MKTARLLAVVVAFAAWLGPREGESCGPFLPEAEFAPVRGPVDPAAYARGDLGVVRPGYRTRELFIAWRILSGAPLNAQETAALYPPPSNRPFVSPAAGWLSARAQVPNLPPAKPIDTYRRSFDPNNFYYYPNCLDDAFDAAAKKLQSLTAARGASSPQVRDWVGAQDQVFENCSAGPSIPAPLGAGADPALAAERSYQIAAAEFYAGQLDAAERDFRAMTGNPAAPYLVARTLIREGTLHADPAKLRDAAGQLNAIIAGSGAGEWKQAARSLLGYVQSRVEPQARLREVSAELLRPEVGPQIATTLDDFIYLWNRRAPKAAPESDFGDWLLAFPSDAEHSIERWRDSHPGALAHRRTCKRACHARRCARSDRRCPSGEVRRSRLAQRDLLWSPHRALARRSRRRAPVGGPGARSAPGRCHPQPAARRTPGDGPRLDRVPPVLAAPSGSSRLRRWKSGPAVRAKHSAQRDRLRCRQHGSDESNGAARTLDRRGLERFDPLGPPGRHRPSRLGAGHRARRP